MANNPELLKMPLARDGQKSTIPETTDASTGLFSQQYGWQSINSLPPQAGGKAVKREDFNGAFNLLGGVAFMAQKGFTFKWSAEQDYYAGCVVIDDTDGLRYECIADVTANSTAPSADSTHWQTFNAGTDIDAWFRQPSTQYSNGAIALLLTLPTGWYLECTGTGGVTSADDLVITSPAVGDTVTDGAVVWTIRKIADTTEATTTTKGLMSAADKTKLNGIANNANNYSLPAATGSTRGGVKIGSNISLSGDTISLAKANVTNALGYTPPTTNELAGKANVDLDNLSAAGEAKIQSVSPRYLTDSYYNSATGDWYRVYSDGWVEQGGFSRHTNSSEFANLNLLKPYSNANYTVVITSNVTNVPAGNAATNCIANKTKTGFQFCLNQQYLTGFNWVAYGKRAQS